MDRKNKYSIKIVYGTLSVVILGVIFIYFLNSYKNLRSQYGYSNILFDSKVIKTIFVGDIMLDRAVRKQSTIDGKESVFENIKEVFNGADAVIGNLEGTVSNRESIAEPGSSILRFTFDPAFMKILHDIGFTAVSLANNHSLDFGHDADAETRTYVNGSDMLTFGSALNTKELSSSIALKDGAFCLVGYHDLFIADPANVIKEIENIRSSCKRVTVFVHWGTEYTHIPSDRQRLLAQSFIDAGADLVIGSHPHVVQPIEIYKNKVIFYSLGNFIFDQNFSFDTMHGLLVNIEWGNKYTRFELVPVSISQAKVYVASGEDRNRVLQMTYDQKTREDIVSSINQKGEFSIEVP